VGTITVYTSTGGKRKGKKRGDQVELKLRVLSTGAKTKSGDNNSICIQEKIKKKRGGQN
jgi:hypothetical protein